MATQLQTYRLWTYDVWNGPDGPFVNDRFQQQLVTLRVRGTVYNAGTPHEFVSFNPTNRQINRAIGARGVKWDGDPEYTLYGNNAKGDPVCELVRERGDED